MSGRHAGLTGKIGTRFVGARCCRGGLPPGNVDGLEVLGHLGDLHWIEPVCCR